MQELQLALQLISKKYGNQNHGFTTTVSTALCIFWKAWVQCWFQQTGFKTCPCKDDGFHSAPALKKSKHGTNTAGQQGAVSISGTVMSDVMKVVHLMSHVTLMFNDMLWGMVRIPVTKNHLDLHKWFGKTQ